VPTVSSPKDLQAFSHYGALRRALEAASGAERVR
jgi:hypothetical protein